MSPQYRRIVAVAVTVLILLPGLAFADVEALFDLSSPATARSRATASRSTTTIRRPVFA